MPRRIENPFTQIWDTLWTLAEANATLMSIVKPRNRIKYTDALGPKQSINDADLPELQLLSNGGTINLKNTSSTTSVIRNYIWAIATGEYDIQAAYNIVSWELLRAMIGWDTTLCALQWPLESGYTYIVRANIMGIEEGTTLLDENRGIVGWAGMWQIDVEMHFRTDDLRLL